MQTTTLMVDDDTATLIQELRASFGSANNRAAIKRAIVLASVITRSATDDIATLLDPAGNELLIMLKA